MKKLNKKIEVFSDGSIVYSQVPDGHNVQVDDSKLDKLKEIPDPDIDIDNTSNYKYNLKTGKLESANKKVQNNL